MWSQRPELKETLHSSLCNTRIQIHRKYPALQQSVGRREGTASSKLLCDASERAGRHRRDKHVWSKIWEWGETFHLGSMKKTTEQRARHRPRTFPSKVEQRNKITDPSIWPILRLKRVSDHDSGEAHAIWAVTLLAKKGWVMATVLTLHPTDPPSDVPHRLLWYLGLAKTRKQKSHQMRIIRVTSSRRCQLKWSEEGILFHKLKRYCGRHHCSYLPTIFSLLPKTAPCLPPSHSLLHSVCTSRVLTLSSTPRKCLILQGSTIPLSKDCSQVNI